MQMLTKNPRRLVVYAFFAAFLAMTGIYSTRIEAASTVRVSFCVYFAGGSRTVNSVEKFSYTAIQDNDLASDGTGIFTFDEAGVAPNRGLNRGCAQINVPKGEIQLWIKGEDTLSALADPIDVLHDGQYLNLYNADGVIHLMILIDGDTNGDNSIDFFDVSAVVSHLAAPPKSSDDPSIPSHLDVDLNEDGSVDFLDYSLVTSNLNFSREAPPNPLDN